MEIQLKCADYTKKLNIKEVIKNVFDFNIGTALTEIVGITESKETKAFLLLFNTFKTTNVQLKKELGQEILDKIEGLAVTSSEFDIAIKNYFEQEITITKDFFQNIIKYNPEYLKKSFKLFKQNLLALKINIPENFEYEYFSTYRSNLQKEFEDNKESYNELIDFFNNPIYEQNRSYNKLIHHYKTIKNFFTNPLQADIEISNESLKDLYIDPLFKFFKNNISNQTTYSYGYEDFEFPEVKISIHDFLINYFFKGIKHKNLKSNYNMLFLLGQPGQGKTSFCYKLVYDYLEENEGLPCTPIYFIKIRDLIAKNFIDDTFQTINKYLLQNINFEEDKCIIILDGLDEAYMAGGLNDTNLKNLYDRLNKTAQQNSNLKIILTSRLNYLKVNDPCLDKSLVCQLSILTDNQISEYAVKFKNFHPKNKFLNKIDTILSESQYIHIKELLQQAVLIYFIAIADIDIEEQDSKANIYDKIFDSLAKRSWDKQKGQLDYIKPKVKEDYRLYTKYLRAYIRNIAFEIYQSPNLYITLDKLSELEATQLFIKRCFNDDLLTSQENIREMNKYLLISFYFQESSNNKTTETAVEFFHNSLWEYLTAEYMWEENKNLLLKREIDDEDEYQTVSKENYFDLLNKLIGQKELSNTIKNNLFHIIKNEKNEINLNVFNQSLKNFYKLSFDDFLLEYSRTNNKLSILQKSTSIFNLFWSFLNYSNYNLEVELVTNSNINKYFFSLSKFAISENIRNINFEGDTRFLYDLLQNEIHNVKFNEFEELKYIIDNHISSSSFLICDFHYCIFRDNVFIDVEFSECNFIEENFFINNTFKNVKFFETEIPNKYWFEILEQQNNLDEETIKNHIIEEIMDFDNEGKEQPKYLIKYIGK